MVMLGTTTEADPYGMTTKKSKGKSRFTLQLYIC